MKRIGLLLLLPCLLLAGCSASDGPPAIAPPMIETGIKPGSWALVPAGEFLMGLHSHETLLDKDFEIMVTPVTNTQFAQYLNEALAAGWIESEGDEILGYYAGDDYHGYEHEERIAAGQWLHIPMAETGLRIEAAADTYQPLNGYENHPAVHVTWFGAKAYCDFYGWRLPSEIEWEKAARGTDGRPYPWGDDIQIENANFYSSHDIFEKVIGRSGDTTPVGFYNGSVYEGFQTIDSTSPYGLYDMAGNVWEWTSDIYEGIHYRYMRGGSKADYAYNLRVWTRNNAAPYYQGPSVGFRCAREPQNE